MRRLALAVALILAPLAAGAISPDEMLPDPAQEARARGLFDELRCVVCQSESIGESNADIARDLRMLVRERIVAGDSDAEAIAHIVERYGEFVLFRPPMTAENMPLWLAAPLFLVFGAAMVATVMRRRARESRRPPVLMSEEEQARVDALMKE